MILQLQVVHFILILIFKYFLRPKLIFSHIYIYMYVYVKSLVPAMLGIIEWIIGYLVFN